MDTFSATLSLQADCWVWASRLTIESADVTSSMAKAKMKNTNMFLIIPTD